MARSSFPVWSIRELLDGLVFQPDSKRRRLLLVLLEVWGEEAYAPVLERLNRAGSVTLVRRVDYYDGLVERRVEE